MTHTTRIREANATEQLQHCLPVLRGPGTMHSGKPAGAGVRGDHCQISSFAPEFALSRFRATRG